MRDTIDIKNLFPGLEEDLYHELEEHGEIKEIKAGEVLMRMGQPIRSTMLILEGAVKLYQQDGEGNEFFIYQLEPGEACAITMVCGYGLGESNMVARTLTDTVLLSVPLKYMDEWMMKYRSWTRFVIQTYRKRFEELLQTVNAIAFRNMDERLEFYLKGQTKHFGKMIRLTHQNIADDLNSSREVISRLLKKMEQLGQVKLHRNYIELLKIE